MQLNSNNYILGVGEQGKERLTILNELFKKTSRNLLLQAGLTKGNHVLEIGCGTGEMTCWIAEQVGNAGRVYAVDISIEQIEIAKRQAKINGVDNITFINSSVFDLCDLPLFDFIYSRFIIMHLHEPYVALQTMLRFLKSSGHIICEEASNAVTCCYPPSPTFQKHRQLLRSLGEKKGFDFNLGEKIYSYFRDLNLQNIFVNFVQPILQTKRQKLIIPLLVTEVKNNYINNQLVTENEIDQLLKELYEFIEDDKYLVSFARTTQIYGQLKPTI